MKNENGITLIALIITIIVMLILVGVTINVALNGGLFDKAKNVAIQTELEQIKEQLVLKKAEIIADNNGNIPSDYGISLSDLELPESIKTKYAEKLIISPDGTLYYTDNATATDIVYFENAGITAYQEPAPDPDPEPEPPANPLVGKTFDCPMCNSFGVMEGFGTSAGDFAITFGENTWEIPFELSGQKYGNGTYTCSDNTIHFVGTLGGNALDETVPLYTITENGKIIEYYFVYSGGFYTEYGNTNFLVPFTGEFTNPDSGKTVTFTIENGTGYGLIGGTSTVFGDLYYCYDMQHDKFYWDAMSNGTVNFSYAQDYSSVTINGTTYTK